MHSTLTLMDRNERLLVNKYPEVNSVCCVISSLGWSVVVGMDM